jgi:antirestriction protein ArdC
MADTQEKIPLRQRITDQIAEAMRKGQPPWRQPWLGDPNSGHPCNFLSKRRYNGINVMLLMMSQMQHGLSSKYWGTMNQWRQLGAYVMPKPQGVQHWGTNIVFFNFIEDKGDDAKPAKPAGKKGGTKKPAAGAKPAAKKMRPMTRVYTVFNVDQVQPPDVDLLAAKPIEKLNEFAKKILHKTFPAQVRRVFVAQLIHDAVKAKLDALKIGVVDHVGNSDPDYGPAEELFKESGAKIKHAGDRAFYSPGDDSITLPPKKLFKNISHYYETGFHELVHWGVVPDRLDLQKSGPYAFNELVAEIGACYLAAELNLPLADEMLPESQKYLKAWLERMGNDVKFIFDAARVASKVTDYLLSFVREEEQADEDQGEDGDTEQERAAS